MKEIIIVIKGKKWEEGRKKLEGKNICMKNEYIVYKKEYVKENRTI